VFCSTLKTREDTIGAATIASLAVQVGSRYMDCGGVEEQVAAMTLSGAGDGVDAPSQK
jgi:hypothetical protein